ncbi:hypothetical protein JG687_00014427 [Phytophthora cactorum]|uniref:Uncharacterized protein n=1 Tax=Phytophthora cactorum TaxID=29920 RepID=A0A8T1TZE2_9STRA|nr:hypothetical protein JG687_00014427 [Phytophthora cactorum]
MMRSWRRLSNWFEDVELELDHLEKVLMDLHDSRGISRKRRSRLTQKLLGQRIVMHGVIRFEWHSGFGRLKSLVGYSDLQTPLLRLLGDVEDVCFVFEKSLARPDLG